MIIVAESMKIGSSFDWVHGNHHRIGTVVGINDTHVFIQGMNSCYWISKKALLKKINKPYPTGGSPMAVYS